MKEILDQEFSSEEKQKDQLTSNRTIKLIAYLVIILVGSFAYFYFIFNVHLPVSFILGQTFINLFITLLISLAIEIIRFFLHKRKEKKQNQKIPRDPFIFQIVEGAFAIWILFSVVAIIYYFFGH